MGPNPIIPIGHKIHLTLEKLRPIHAIPTFQIEPTWKKEPKYAILAYQMKTIIENCAHQCNTCISNTTYIGNGNPSM